MTDQVRRGVLGGAVAAVALGLAKTAGAQALAVGTPEISPDADSLQQQLGEVSPPPETPQPIAQALPSDWAGLARYRTANQEVVRMPAFNRRAVFMGDSITDSWPGFSGDVFSRHGLIGRGISGQTTAQMVARFPQDVLALRPVVVHIMAGTNDLAENLEPYRFEAVTANLSAMIDLAVRNSIRVVVGSIPPASSFAWRPALGDRSSEIARLNDWIRQMCVANSHVYADYWTVLNDGWGGLKPDLGSDSVHPNAAGYAVMMPIALAAIDRAMAPAGT